ncbi:MAG: ATP-binding protein [Pseudomonadota bacterium]
MTTLRELIEASRRRSSGAYAVALLGMATVGAIAYLFYLLSASLSGILQTTGKESDGLRMEAALLDMVQDVESDRLQSTLELAGLAAPRARETSRQAMQAHFARADALTVRYAATLQIGAAWESARAHWLALQGEAAQAPLHGPASAHTALQRELLAIVAAVTQNSTLLLDPQAPSYSLMDAATVKLPGMLALLGQLRTHGAAAMAGQGLDARTASALVGEIAVLRNRIEEVDLALERARLSNPAIGPAVLRFRREFDAASAALFNSVEYDIIDGAIEGAPQEFAARASAVIDLGFARVRTVLLPQLDQLLQLRTREVQRELYLGLATAAASALMLILVLASQIRRLLARPLAHMRDLANAIVLSGDYGLRVPLVRSREWGEASLAINRMLSMVEFQTAAIEARQAGTARLNDSLQLQQQVLEEKIAERTAALVASLKKAEAANLAKEVFLSNMSHELRTPLHAILGFSRLMVAAPESSPTQRENLRIIERSGEHLLTLINEVLELSRILSGRAPLEMEPASLEALVVGIDATLRPRAQQAGLGLAIELSALPQLLMVDAGKLRQVLLNLLDNAVKFTPHGAVRLEVAGEALPGGRWRLDFAVIDSGIGIHAEAQEAIFDPFTQLVTHATSAGTGLGLTICRKYLDMMESSLRIDSRVGVGTTVRFALELAPAPDMDGLPLGAARQLSVRAAEPGRLDLAALPDALRTALLAAVRELNTASQATVLRQIALELPVLAAQIEQMIEAAHYIELCRLLERDKVAGCTA